MSVSFKKSCALIRYRSACVMMRSARPCRGYAKSLRDVKLVISQTLDSQLVPISRWHSYSSRQVCLLCLLRQFFMPNRQTFCATATSRSSLRDFSQRAVKRIRRDAQNPALNSSQIELWLSGIVFHFAFAFTLMRHGLGSSIFCQLIRVCRHIAWCLEIPARFPCAIFRRAVNTFVGAWVTCFDRSRTGDAILRSAIKAGSKLVR